MILQAIVSWYRSLPQIARLAAEAVAGATLILGLYFAGWYMHHYVFDPDSTARESTRAEVVSAFVTLLAGSAVVIAAYSAWQNYQTSRENLAVAQETLKSERDRVIGEQFARAVDQLGSTTESGPVREVRIGAVYTLEQIAKDWYARRHLDNAWVIVETLSAYVRMNQRGQRQSYPYDHILGMPGPDLSERPNQAFLLDPVIETSLDVLGRRCGKYADPNETKRPNLRGVDFEAMSVSGRNLRQFDISGCNFRYSFLRRSDLRCANLRASNFEGAVLEDAQLQGADIFGANFCHTVIMEDGEPISLSAGELLQRSPHDESIHCYPNTAANLRGVDFAGVDLRMAYGLTVEQLLEAKNINPDQLPRHLKTEYQARTTRAAEPQELSRFRVCDDKLSGSE